jgi:hypothetical protein
MGTNHSLLGSMITAAYHASHFVKVGSHIVRC